MFTFFNKEGNEIDMEAMIPVVKKDIIKIMGLRGDAKKLEEDAKGLKKEASEELNTLFVLVEGEGVTRIAMNGFGSVSKEANVPRNTLDQDKLKELLIAKGLSATVVKNCFEKATKIGKVKEPFKYVFRDK